jgi:hypothetical protein
MPIIGSQFGVRMLLVDIVDQLLDGHVYTGQFINTRSWTAPVLHDFFLRPLDFLLPFRLGCGTVG